MLWMIENQRGRRNLADIDKIDLRRKREHILRRKGKANQATSTGGTNPQLLAKLPKAAKIDTRKQSAAAAGVGERTYDAGKLILEAAEKGDIPQQTIDDLRNRKVAVHRVAKDIKETRQREGREKKRVEAVKEITIPENLIIGDFREHADNVPDGSLSLIFTDPPYDRKASEMLPELGEFAAAKLAEEHSAKPCCNFVAVAECQQPETG